MDFHSPVRVNELWKVDFDVGTPMARKLCDQANGKMILRFSHSGEGSGRDGKRFVQYTKLSLNFCSPD